ncbi:DnaJ (Hsp40), subfamily C, member 11 [Cichlidogyrus casuarinus]|uniref:DnaJ (Hsp40), subfamily C, member 11 n=1 Tax=Cichlidogyrus casuarinus TaxID=1844966 RepID=A0ABD2PYW1_9PLAT
MQGLELSTGARSVEELRLRYLILRAKEREQRRLNKLKANSRFSLGLDVSELFEGASQPRIRLTEVNLAQSVCAALTLHHKLQLSGQVMTARNIGIGLFDACYEYRTSPLSYLGTGCLSLHASHRKSGLPFSLALGYQKEVTQRTSLYSQLRVGIISRDNHLLLKPLLSFGGGVNISPDLVLRAKCTTSSVRTDLLWRANKFDCDAKLSLFLAEPEWAGPDEDDDEEEPRSKKGVISLGVNCTLGDGLEVTGGFSCFLSRFSMLSMELSCSLVGGVVVQVNLHRKPHTFSFPIRFAKASPEPAVLGYSIFIPLLTYAALRRLVYEPWLLDNLVKAEKMRRVQLSQELRRRRTDAQAVQNLMKDTAKRIADRETRIGGLVIEKALFGLLPENPFECSPQGDDGDSTWTDVTIALQTMVVDSELRIPPSKFSDLNGFYDPCLGLCLPSTNKTIDQVSKRLNRPGRQLAVLYKFHSAAHQIVVLESQGLAIPMAKHQVS